MTSRRASVGMLLLAGCARSPATPTATATSIATPTATVTPTATSIATPTPTPTPTPTATATSTPTSTATSTPTSTATSTPTSTATSTSTAAPYSLATDVADRIDAAAGELGRGASSAVVSDTFVLVAPPGNARGFQASVDLARRTLDAYFDGRFAAHPGHALSVYLFFDRATYAEYCQRAFHEPCLSPFGFWRPDERRIVMNAAPGLGTLTHELVHPIVDADFPDAPIWINEGIASLFEAPVLAGAHEIHGAKNWRLPRLVRALASPKEAPHARLATLFGMSDDVFRDDDEDLHYALARYVCQWLDAHAQLWPFYHAWRDGFATDPTGARAFERVTRATPDAASAAWERWVKSL